jgi:DNA-binding MarR family transcriptional regulator
VTDESKAENLGAQLGEMVARELASRTVLFHQAIAERIGLNVTDHRCLDIALRASQEGPLTAGRLAELTGLTTGAITGVLDRLEKADFVRREKDPNDRRQVLVRLTGNRATEMAELYEPLGKAFSAICARYTKEELERVLGIFRDMSEVLRTQTDRVRGAPSETTEASAPVTNVKEGRLEFTHGSSHVVLRPSDGPLLYQAKFAAPGPKITAKNGHVVVEYTRSLFRMFSWKKESAEILLHRGVPWDIVVRGGLMRMTGDLDGLVLAGLEISGGAADLTLALPEPKGTVSLSIRGGVHNVTLNRPGQSPARLHITHGASDLTIDAMHLGAVGGDTRWESPEFADATDRYDIRITGGARSFSLGLSR